jgi:hypothetical protein
MANTLYNVAYAQKQDNSEKSHWLNCGILIVKEDGKMSLKLNAIPVNCDGWFSIFERDENKTSAVKPAPSTDDFDL